MLLSVVTCNYNHADFLSNAIQSVIDQQFTSIQYILIDDGSTDHSQQIMQTYAKEFPWIEIHVHQQNKGVLYSINEALSLAKGEYIHFLSADDQLLPEFFHTSVAALQACPDAAVCCSQSCFFDKDPFNPIEISNFDLEYPSRYYPPSEVMDLYKNTTFWISGSNIMRLRLARQYGFHPKIEAFNDWFLYQQLSLQHGMVYIPRIFYANRRIKGSYASSIWTHKGRRNQAFYHLITAVTQHESKAFKNAFRRGASLAFYGKKMLFFLLKTPKFWRFIPPILIKKFKEKFFAK